VSEQYTSSDRLFSGR